MILFENCIRIRIHEERWNKFLSQRRCSLTCLVTRLHTAKRAEKCSRVFWHFAILDGIIILHVCVCTSPTSRDLLSAIPDNSLMDRAACKSRTQGFKVGRETTHEPHTIASIVLLLDDAECSINYSETMRDDPGPPIPASLLPSFNVLSTRSTAFFSIAFHRCGKRLGTLRKSYFGGGFVNSKEVRKSVWIALEKSLENDFAMDVYHDGWCSFVKNLYSSLQMKIETFESWIDEFSCYS